VLGVTPKAGRAASTSAKTIRVVATRARIALRFLLHHFSEESSKKK